MAADLVERLRRFNRTVTQRIGVLEETFLSRGRPLNQSRVLWEIGVGGCAVRALRERLDLDSGYLSRLLRALQDEGLVAVDPDGEDARVRRVRLTPAGLAERAELDRRADALAASILDPLDERQRDRLGVALAEVERLMVASMVRVQVTDPRHPDARACVAAYFTELAQRFEGGFDPGRSVPAADDELTPPAGALLVARLHAEPVGCVGLKTHAGGTVADVKRMWVSPAVRGLGLGRRLLAEVEDLARRWGVRTLRLETNGTLTEAVSLYRACGYREVPRFSEEPYAHHWFAKDL